MNNNIDRYAVFGNPIAHSKSPLLHKAFAEQTQQTLVYEAQCIDINDFNNSADQFFSSGGKGLNITVPFKENAFAYAKKLTTRAQAAEAVNTLFIDQDNTIVGDNTDGVGLVSDISTNLNWPIKDKNILIVGAGGAVKGIIEPLIEQQPQSITIVNRTLAKAEAIAQKFADSFSITASAFTDLKSEPVDIIINGTSASLSGELPPLPESIITAETACYDMMYGPSLTPFLSWAKQCGCEKISDGLGMLVCQGAESFSIWRGVQPETQSVINQLRKAL